MVRPCTFADGSEMSTRFMSLTELTLFIAVLNYILHCVVVNKVYKFSEAEKCAEWCKEIKSFVREDSDWALRMCGTVNLFAIWIRAEIMRRFDSLHTRNMKIVDLLTGMSCVWRSLKRLLLNCKESGNV